MSKQTTVTASAPNPLKRGWQAVHPWLIGIIFIAAATTIVVTPIGRAKDELLDLQIGDVAPRDIVALRSQTYISEIQLDAAQSAASASVAPVYDPPDTRISRQQVTNAQAALNFINSVRSDSYATSQQKSRDLAELTEVDLTQATIIVILRMTDVRWEATKAEVMRVIEEVMSDQVRSDQLVQAQQRIPSLVSVMLSVEEAKIVSSIAGEFIIPNSLFNEVATNQARASALEAVEPVQAIFGQGQTIVGRGQVVEELDMEAMQALGLLEKEIGVFEKYVPSATVSILVTVIMALYLNRQRPDFFKHPRKPIFLALVVLIFLAGAQVSAPQRVLMAFVFPSAALGMLVAVALGTHMGLAVTLLFSILLGVIVENRQDVVIYHIVGSTVAILALGNAARVNNYFWAGLAAAGGHAAVILLGLGDPLLDLTGIAELLIAGVASGAISASLTLMGFFLLGTAFDITTALQLVELSRPNHPLLAELLRVAPGTYQHSLHVANLAEQAAQDIGANSLLTRVSALYHDIGKSRRPSHFVENQIEGVNPHDRLDPHSSAQIIIDHVRDGDAMARRHRLPSIIRAAITEHQGTLTTMYQYQNALEDTSEDIGDIDIKDFTYPGPKPQSRETALLMLADGCEAKARADLPQNEEEIGEIVRHIITRIVQHGQLNECSLSLADLEKVRMSFVNTLKGFYHSRLKYPSEYLADATLEKQMGSSSDTPPDS